jgi:predicted kinase
VAPEQRLPRTAYSDAASEAVFAALAALVRETVDGGHAVIADATFIDPRHRIMIETAACAVGVPFVGLWLEVPLAELEARITARRRDASDATIAVLRAASRSNPRAGDWISVDATDAAGARDQALDAVRPLM